MAVTVKPAAPRRAAKRASTVTRPASNKPAPAKAGRKTSGAAPSSPASSVAKAAAKPAKAKKPKLVRDSFTIPKEEYAVLVELKQRCAALAHPAKKSELLRAGIKAMAGLNDKALLAALLTVPSIKTGRPQKA